MKVMTVEQVYRVKGTQLVGRLECDVLVGEKLIIGSHSVVLFGIENFAKIRESACAGEAIALAFHYKEDLKDVEPGAVVTKEVGEQQ